MTPELKALGRRAVACEGWRWMPGMAWCLPMATSGPFRGRMIGDSPSGLLLSDGLPDLSDPATVGCLLALVRETWGDPGIGIACVSHTYKKGYCYRVTGGHRHEMGFYVKVEQQSYGTEAEALVAALEAAGGEG